MWRNLLNHLEYRKQFQVFKACLDSKFQTNTNATEIKTFMKKELRYAFKRGSSRPLASSKRESIYLQSMFSCRMLIAIHHKEFIVNVDGSSFSRSIKNNHSWLSERKSMPILNTLCKGSTNILLALSIDVRWFLMIPSESSTCFTFCIFSVLLQN